MLPRLLCFLSDVEQSLVADDPAPDNGTWKAQRTVNYHLALARLVLHVQHGDQDVRPRGVLNLQAFTLADGTSCLKAALSWTGSPDESVHSIYTKPGLNWQTEARRVAAVWLAGPPAAAATATVHSVVPETEAHPLPLATTA
jgi:hypothetical protein